MNDGLLTVVIKNSGMQFAAYRSFLLDGHSRNQLTAGFDFDHPGYHFGGGGFPGDHFQQFVGGQNAGVHPFVGEGSDLNAPNSLK